MSKKINCWEFMKCGRELGGKRVEKYGVCPVATSPPADGLKAGVNGEEDMLDHCRDLFLPYRKEFSFSEESPLP